MIKTGYKEFVNTRFFESGFFRLGCCISVAAFLGRETKQELKKHGWQWPAMAGHGRPSCSLMGPSSSYQATLSCSLYLFTCWVSEQLWHSMVGGVSFCGMQDVIWIQVVRAWSHRCAQKKTSSQYSNTTRGPFKGH